MGENLMAAIYDNQYVGLRAFGQVTAADASPGQWKIAVYSGPFQEGTSEITRTTALVDENTLSIVPAPPGKPLPGELALWTPDSAMVGAEWDSNESIRCTVLFWATTVVIAPDTVALVITSDQRLALAFASELRSVSLT
jgi:hypothetical protein